MRTGFFNYVMNFLYPLCFLNFNDLCTVHKKCSAFASDICRTNFRKSLDKLKLICYNLDNARKCRLFYEYKLHNAIKILKCFDNAILSRWGRTAVFYLTDLHNAT